MENLRWGIAILIILGILVGDGSGQNTECINKLIPCLNYLNGTKDVPNSCCDPLKDVIKSDPKCLCSMISNKGSNKAEQAGINITEAQMLPARCGLRVNPLSCITTTGSPNTKNSVDNNSAGELLFPSWTLMMAIAFSFLQILLCCQTV